MISMGESEKKIYCYKCNHYVDYNVSLVKEKIEVRGVFVNVQIYKCSCKDCGEEVYVYEYEKKNDLIVFDAYKKQVGLLTSEQIKAIRKKRDMSQVDLAKFLGIGEKDIARYESGSIQNRSIDNMIRLVDDDVAYKRMLVVLYDRGKWMDYLKSSVIFVDLDGFANTTTNKAWNIGSKYNIWNSIPEINMGENRYVRAPRKENKNGRTRKILSVELA